VLLLSHDDVFILIISFSRCKTFNASMHPILCGRRNYVCGLSVRLCVRAYTLGWRHPLPGQVAADFYVKKILFVPEFYIVCCIDSRHQPPTWSRLPMFISNDQHRARLSTGEFYSSPVRRRNRQFFGRTMHCITGPTRWTAVAPNGKNSDPTRCKQTQLTQPMG